MQGGLSFNADTEKEDTADDMLNDIADVQAGHRSHAAGMIYARGIMEVSEKVASKRQRFRESSQE